MDEIKIINTLNQIANEINNKQIKNELEDISIRLAGRFTRFNPNFKYLEEIYKRDRFNLKPLERPEREIKIPGFSDFSINFSGLSEEYQISVFRSIFNNFEINEDLPKGFLDFIFRDIRFGHAVLKFVKNNNLQEIYAKMFEVYENYVDGLLDKIIQSKKNSYEIEEKVEYLEDVLKEFLTPALKNKLKAMLEVLERETNLRTEVYNASRIFSPDVEKIRMPKLQQQAEQELKQVMSNNKKQIIASLNNIAKNLDKLGYIKEAEKIDNITNNI